MAPIVYGGLVYISTIPGTGVGPTFYRAGDRGVLYALDALTGRIAWWFDTTDNGFGAPRLAGGGGLWYPPSFDAAGNIYFGVGNPSPWPLTPACPNADCRPGDNRYTSGMVSLDGRTGGVRWFYQDRPHDLFDHDFQHTPILTTVGINGQATRVAIGAGKTGAVVAVNADTGAVLWRTLVGKHENDTLTALPTNGTLEIYPGAYGGVESPIAYADGTVFATYVNLPQYEGATGADPNRTPSFATGTGALVALDAATGAIKWETPINTLVVGGATVANNVVFTGGLDGFFRAFDTATGKQLWAYEAPRGFNAPPAIAGDMVFAAAGFVKLPPAGTTPASPAAAVAPAASPAAAPPAQLIAFRLGGPIPGATPAGGAAAPTATTAAAAPGAASPAAAGPAGQTAQQTVAMVDIAFQPNTLTIPANTDVTIRLVNQGTSVHNFNIDQLNVHSGDYHPGQTGTVTIHAAPGDYRYYCSIPGHEAAGMVGTLHVT